MAKRGTGGIVATLRQKAGPRSGFVRAVIYVPPDQLAALHQFARERAEARGALRPDVSEAARFVFEHWTKRR